MVVSIENITQIVKDAIGGMKDYVDEKLAATKSKVLESSHLSQIQF